MNILLLVQDEQRIILDNFYAHIAAQFEHADIVRLSSKEQSDLRLFFEKNVDVTHYDRIILFLRFKKEIKQVAFLREIPNLVFLEHDAYQNYAESKYKGVFSKHYKKLPWVRVLCSGYQVAEKLQAEGIDSVFVPKGYDEKLISCENTSRDIELGFVGSIKSKTYSARKELLENLQKEEDLLITRTKSGDEYRDTLNRIKFFISADVGMGEYMIKNFEAMAAGCVLFAWNQGDKENMALGFKDMDNIVLYSSANELKTKLAILRGDEELCRKIAENGNRLASTHFCFSKIAEQLCQAVTPSLREKVIKRKLFFKQYSYR